MSLQSAARAFSRPDAPSTMTSPGVFRPRLTRSSSACQAASLSLPMLQHFLAVLPDAQRDQQGNRCRLFVEPHAHHRPVEDQPDDRLIGEQTGIPSVPIALCLAPNTADRVLPHGAAEQSHGRPAHPAPVGPGKIGRSSSNSHYESGNCRQRHASRKEKLESIQFARRS